ncbi:hypothetical protein [Streptomyces sp. B6B3]|uniref:hypothetical protein n=1 Tax=Streptomyces sp. B6B3 TaxID=3153570 RepID=UPI00325E5F77
MDPTPAMPDRPPSPPPPASTPPASTPDPDPDPAPEPTGARTARRSRDPFAVALANVSLLGAGYLMLGRRRLAVGTVAATAVLVAVLASGAQATWFRIAVLLWWVALVLHGWYLAGGWPRRTARDATAAAVDTPNTPNIANTTATTATDLGRPGVRRQRLVALGVAAPVLLVFAVLRVDAAGIERDAADAHRGDDCAAALSILDGLWAGHQVTDPALVDRADDAVEACELLLRAERQAEDDRLRAADTLETYEEHPAALWEGAPGRRADLVLAEAAEEFDSATVSGDTAALATGFDQLATVLAEFPGQENEVERVLDGFLDALPLDDACDTRDVTDWLAGRPTSDDVLDRAADVVPTVAPAAIVGCADDAMADDHWDQARDRYQQLLDEYPDHDLAAQAADGVERAETAIEFDQLRELLAPGSGSSGDQPAYCDDPAPYRGAEPFRGDGSNPALVYGEPASHEGHLPGSWLADGADDAVLVICVGDLKQGTSVCTERYETPLHDWGTEVTFHNRRFPVEVYEVRTGERVSDERMEIGGTGCPYTVEYEYYGIDTGPPSDMYVDSSPSDVSSAYESLITP